MTWCGTATPIRSPDWDGFPARAAVFDTDNLEDMRLRSLRSAHLRGLGAVLAQARSTPQSRREVRYRLSGLLATFDAGRWERLQQRRRRGRRDRRLQRTRLAPPGGAERRGDTEWLRRARRDSGCDERQGHEHGWPVPLRPEFGRRPVLRSGRLTAGTGERSRFHSSIHRPPRWSPG